MRTSPHRIRTLRWQVRAGSQEEAFVLRQCLRDGLDSELLPVMAEAFDAADPVDGVLHIPRLELRLEIAATDRFMERLAELLRRRLGELLSAAGTVPPTEEGATPVRHLAGNESRFEAVAHYLETGGLPWAAAGPDRAGTVEELRRTASRELERLLASRRADSSRVQSSGETVAFYFRLLQLLPDEEWGGVAKAVAARYPDGLGETFEPAFAESAVPGSGSRYSRLRLAAVLLAAAGMSADVASAEVRFDAMENLIRSLPEATAAVFRRWLAGGGRGAAILQRTGPVKERFEGAGKKLERMSEPSSSSPSVRGLRPSPPAPIGVDFRRQEGWEAPSPTLQRGGGKGRGPLGAEEEDPSPTLPCFAGEGAPTRLSGHKSTRMGAEGEGQRPQTFSRETFESRFQQPAVPPGLPAILSQAPEPGVLPLAVSHAGLILLHPFLPRFFESTGVLEAREVHLPAAVMPRAAALLHLLATGEEEAWELELGFIKILLGVTPEDPLPVAAGLLTESDWDEADALLQAVIGHWSVLKNTSVAGLRQTFLQRRGLVREGDEGFRLQVEPESFDVLLGHLPWGIATVKLPWMSKAIYTDWPTP